MPADCRINKVYPVATDSDACCNRSIETTLIELFFLAAFIPLRNHLVGASQYRSGPRAVSLAD